ncbi:MAG TPA: MipA/OmpV family protein [Povalibacter sp.]|nr:MipA/OmpV family protein [Povalibacter sp.]
MTAMHRPPAVRRFPLVPGRVARHTLFAGFALAISTAWCAAAPAPRNGCTSPSPDCVEVGELDISVSLGLGSRSNPVLGESDIPLVVIPQISYYGKRFFLENLDLGFTLYEGRANTFNLLASPGYDRVFFYRNDLQNIFVSGASGAITTAEPPPSFESPPQEFEVRPRHVTYLAGPEWLFNYGRVIGQLDALYEVTGEHDGYEVRAAVAAPIIQTQHSLVLSAGLTWKSAAVVRYYYGVEGFYEPGSAFNPFIKLGYTHALSNRWTLSAFAHYEHLGSAIADSPIVGEDGVTTVFAGVVFKIL